MTPALAAEPYFSSVTENKHRFGDRPIRRLLPATKFFAENDQRVTSRNTLLIIPRPMLSCICSILFFNLNVGRALSRPSLFEESGRYQGRARFAFCDTLDTPTVPKSPLWVSALMLWMMVISLFVAARAQEVTTLAGSGSRGFSDATGSAAQFYNPFSVAVDGAGNVYVADAYNHRIRKITSGGVVTTLAGSGTPGSEDGAGTAARFRYPQGVAVDGVGNIYVADTDNSRIRRITTGGVVTTLAGSGSAGFNDGTGTAARFNYPQAVAVDVSGNLYVADYDNNRIRKITSGGEVTTLAGSGFYGFSDGAGTSAQFRYPSGVAVDGAGNVYVADFGNNRIRKINSIGVVSTLAGSGATGSADGVGTAAQIYAPSGVAVDGAGNVYVAASGNIKIRKITNAGDVTTLAGSGSTGFVNGTGAASQFNNPVGVAVDVAGTVYVADAGNHAIRRITGMAPTTSPAFISAALNPTLITGTAYTATIAASGNPSPTFSVQNGVLPLGLVLDANTGALSGTPTTAGTYSGVFGATNSQGTATQVFTFTVELTFASFRAQSFTVSQLADSMVSGPGADPDADGRTNLLEYALGSAPMNADASDNGNLVKTGPTTWIYRYSRPVGRSDLTYTVETTTSLANSQSWTPATQTTVSAASGLETVEATLPPPAPAVFSRLRVTINPVP